MRCLRAGRQGRFHHCGGAIAVARCGHTFHGACLIQRLLATQHNSHLRPTRRQAVEHHGLTNYRILN
eukprot:3339529-Lingulodinium_polyedra.AAC.1